MDHADFDDIPGTTVFTVTMARRGYHLNQFCMSLMTPDNRARFKADERAYVDEWAMTDAQKRAVLTRDYNAAIAEGGNIYFLGKIIAADGQSFLQGVSTLTEISRRTGLPVATAYRLVGELTGWGALERDDRGRYRIGIRLYEVAMLVPRSLRLHEAAMPFLEDLYEATHENVQLAVLDGAGVVYVEHVAGRNAIGVFTRPGLRWPATPRVSAWCCSPTPRPRCRRSTCPHRWSASPNGPSSIRPNCAGYSPRCGTPRRRSCCSRVHQPRLAYPRHSPASIPRPDRAPRL